MKKVIKMSIECPACAATGVYVGMGERDGAAVVCTKCDGTGSYEYKYYYTEFTNRKIHANIKRVYKSGYGYVIGTGKIRFNDTEVDMGKEGISYASFLSGEMPKHTEAIGCPLFADQSACHKIKGFTERCNRMNGGWLSMINSCKNQCNKAYCWKLFNSSKV